jgi:hypothetical protein
MEGGSGAEATTAIGDTKPSVDVKMESGDEDIVKEEMEGGTGAEATTSIGDTKPSVDVKMESGDDIVKEEC